MKIHKMGEIIQSIGQQIQSENNLLKKLGVKDSSQLFNHAWGRLVDALQKIPLEGKKEISQQLNALACESKLKQVGKELLWGESEEKLTGDEMYSLVEALKQCKMDF